MTAEELVRKVIAEEWEPDGPYTLETSIADFGSDSLDTVELVMCFEEELNVEVPNDETAKLKTVGDVVELVKRYGKDKITDEVRTVGQ
jgi:acyl carrier protein